MVGKITRRRDTVLFFSSETKHVQGESAQFSSVAQSCPALCDPMNRSTPGLLVHHQRPEFTQTHVHRVSDAIQPSHPLLSPSPPALNPSQYQSFPMSQLYAWGGQSTGVSALASFLPKKSQGWSPSEWTGWISLQSKGLSLLQHHSSKASILWHSVFFIEKATEFQKNIYFCFIDYAKAFDCVDHNKLENFERDGNTRPPDLPFEKPICRSGSNS